MTAPANFVFNTLPHSSAPFLGKNLICFTIKIRYICNRTKPKPHGCLMTAKVCQCNNRNGYSFGHGTF